MIRTHKPTLIISLLPVLLCSALNCTRSADDSGQSSRSPAADTLTASYVGREQCVDCHRKEAELWSGSHHDRAMQAVSESTVLGNFNSASFTWYGVTSRFLRRAGKFIVVTEGPAGGLHEYEVKYTFGVTPLQQYLVEFPGGRLQTLPLCWDTRSKEQGGQRWFHIYQNERIVPGDELFWTGLMQNWNFMCADCHSTDLQKKYSVDTSAFRTSWSEINVSCEACHGPGSEHVAWGKRVQAGWKPRAGDRKGLPVQLNDPAGGTWVFDAGAKTARRTVPVRPMTQVEVCAQCHSRRARIDPSYNQGGRFMDTFVPQLLDEGMYYADGQIRDEVYVYASFRQSKMYHKGVVCTDCHEPHGARIYSPGNTVCYRCHLQGSYGTRAHHFHNPDSTGAACTGCHMPTTTYMVVDPRLDHSIRIPRPDFTVRFGIPNACNKCHPTKSPQWAADSLARWYPHDGTRPVHYGEILQAGRIGAPGAEAGLVHLATDPAQPAIVRATALSLLDRYGGPASSDAISRVLLDPDPIVRLGAVKGIEGLPLDRRFAMGRGSLNDAVRAVRLEAVRVLAPVSPQGLSAADNSLMDQRVMEYEEMTRYNGDRPTSWAMLGNVYAGRQRSDEAATAYRNAISLDSLSPLGYVNLADLYRSLGREDDGKRLLKRGISLSPKAADLHYALGLLLIRQGKRKEGLVSVGRALQIDSANTRYTYVYAVGLHDAGESNRSVRLLENAVRRSPYNTEILFALVQYYREAGDPARALPHATTLLALMPDNPQVIRLYQEVAVRP